MSDSAFSCHFFSLVRISGFQLPLQNVRSRAVENPFLEMHFLVSAVLRLSLTFRVKHGHALCIVRDICERFSAGRVSNSC
jgi:hypothetical protein